MALPNWPAPIIATGNSFSISLLYADRRKFHKSQRNHHHRFEDFQFFKLHKGKIRAETGMLKFLALIHGKRGSFSAVAAISAVKVARRNEKQGLFFKFHAFLYRFRVLFSTAS
jgi:hypothetical protein